MTKTEMKQLAQDLLTKTEMKHLAQDLLMLHGKGAFKRIEDIGLNEEEKKQVYSAMHEEFTRMEKLFGFDPGSWSRGV